MTEVRMERGCSSRSDRFGMPAELGRPAPHPQRRAHAIMVASLLAADSPRLGGINEDHVRLLAETDMTLPPILVHRNTMRVIDGMHRLHAARLKGQHEIAVEFFHGNRDEAFLRAVQENVAHGLPLSLAERRAAARRIIASHPQLSDRALATATGLAAKTIATLRRGSTADSPQLSARIGADGRLHPLDGSAGRLRAAEIIADDPGAPLRQVARAAGVSVGTAHDVRTRIRRGENPLPLQQRTPRVVSEPSSRPALARPRNATTSLRGSAQTRAGRSILQSLMKDPSLRHTNTGRELLRWLCTHVITADNWPSLIEAVPPHCAEVVAELARQCARTWEQFAQELQQRTHAV
jgi:ParB-like chromosome segregation protein Spo0J